MIDYHAFLLGLYAFGIITLVVLTLIGVCHETRSGR